MNGTVTVNKTTRTRTSAELVSGRKCKLQYSKKKYFYVSGTDDGHFFVEINLPKIKMLKIRG